MSTARSTSRLTVVVAVLAGLAVGLAAAFFLAGGDDDPPAAVSTTTDTRDGDPEALAELPTPEPPAPPGEATDPEVALRSFLGHEIAGEWETSYELLAPDLRDLVYPTPAVWVEAHADLPTVTGYRIDDVSTDEDAGTATIRTLTGFEPVLDHVLGLVAARGRSEWSLTRTEDGLWRVDTNATTNQMLYPGSEGASEAARAWVDGRLACEDTAALEERLVGSPAVADGLCSEEQPDGVEITAIGPLTDSAAVAPVLSEFGPEVFAWARAARVQAATPFTLVLGPLGDEWKVVGVLP